ncbi:hypothetical protein F2P81_022890 [Scophthalmus maximus]|uniref:HTH CENPB-type domain-containing protein n=1 Tax=Scophthalmus maximus TaxID=52904 RepID=A0A6A4RVS6_SCOMX|nr:hypothetical protein F2P81_022890 [Scophthalmus maximus]
MYPSATSGPLVADVAEGYEGSVVLSLGLEAAVSPMVDEEPDPPPVRTSAPLLPDQPESSCSATVDHTVKLCSPVIAQSLKEVRKKNKPRRWSREKKKKSQKMKSSSKVTRTPLPVRPRTPSDDELSDELSDRFTSPAHSAVFSGPRQDPAPPRGKLVILVEDFYYGSARGRSSAQPDPRGGKFTGPEPLFLWHMKNTHRPGEMPYVCQKKHVFGCDKCRLHFLYVKERMEHKLLHHRTHVRPAQLTGLKPGTKVVDVAPPLPPQEAPHRRPVESMGPLLSSLSEAAGVSRPLQRCVECLSVIRSFRTHFPSLVHCSLCRFLTCCATAYANHMINNHETCRKNPQYRSLFQSDPRVTSPGGRFVPIHLLPSRETSTPLSVKPLASPSPLSSPPAMTITFLGPHPQPELPPDSPLSVFQLAAVLTSLCYGLAQAARRCQTPAAAISSWIWQQERALRGRTWSWRTEKLAEWLLKQREQQLVVSEDVLLQEARGILGEDSQLTERYSWTVDFMLRHDATLQTGAGTRTLLPLDIKEKIHTFTQTLRSLIRSRALPPHRVGCMDEFSIFVRSDSTHHLTPSSFQLCGSLDDMPLFDVMLSALSDGTLLCPLLFFRGTSSHLPDGFPDNVLLRARPDGFTDNERLHIWMEQVETFDLLIHVSFFYVAETFQSLWSRDRLLSGPMQVWRPRVATSAWDGQSVLMVDVHRGHLTHHFLSSFTDVVVIPSGCSCRLQPLHVCVTPVLRDFLQVRWTQLVSQGLDGLGLDQLALTLACWLSELCSTVNSESDILRRSFSSVCDLQQVDDRWETERMIRVLNEALILPLEEPGPGPRLTPGPGQGPELELLLVMEKEKQEKMESREEMWTLFSALMELTHVSSGPSVKRPYLVVSDLTGDLTVSRAKDYNFTPSPDYEYDYDNDNDSLKISFYSNTSSQEFDKFSEKYIDQEEEEEEVTEATEVTGGWLDEEEATVTMATTRGATERVDVRNATSFPPSAPDTRGRSRRPSLCTVCDSGVSVLLTSYMRKKKKKREVVVFVVERLNLNVT